MNEPSAFERHAAKPIVKNIKGDDFEFHVLPTNPWAAEIFNFVKGFPRKKMSEEEVKDYLSDEKVVTLNKMLFAFIQYSAKMAKQEISDDLTSRFLMANYVDIMEVFFELHNLGAIDKEKEVAARIEKIRARKHGATTGNTGEAGKGKS